MDATSPIVVDVALEPRDLTWSLARSIHSIFWWFVFFLGVLLFFAIVQTTETGFHPFSNSLTFPFLLFLSVVVGLAVPYIRITRLFGKVPLLRQPRRMTLGPEGLRIDSQSATGEYRWTFFYEIKETEKSFLFQQTPQSASPIPKRCFQTSDEIRRFKAMLREHYHGKLKLRAD